MCPAAQPAVPAHLRRAIADRGDDAGGWVVVLLCPERERCHGATVPEALARCPVPLTVEEFAGGTIA